MTEWWTYRLSDFLLFSPRAYFRMIERLNETLWPAHLLTLALGCVILVFALRPTPTRLRVVWAALALLWIWIAWSFLWRRYSAINWAAVYAVPLFALQALLLLMEARSRGSTGNGPHRRRRAVGLVLLLVGLAGYPVIAPILGRGWEQAEVFGLAPDPTVVATLGVAILLPARSGGWLLAIPMAWCLISGLTLWAMQSPEALLPAGAALLSVVSSWMPAPSAVTFGRQDRTSNWHASN
jgi:hypothetical protein